MNEQRFDEAINETAEPPGRRKALRALSATGMALLTVMGLGSAAESKKKRRRREHDRAGEPQAEGKKGKRGPAGPAGPTGPTGPAGISLGGGATGPTGPTGPRGVIGPTGASGPVRVVYGQKVIVDVPPGYEQTGDSRCPAGSTPVGASIFIGNSAFCTMSTSMQLGDSWRITLMCPSNHASPENTIQAICLVTS